MGAQLFKGEKSSLPLPADNPENHQLSSSVSILIPVANFLTHFNYATTLLTAVWEKGEHFNFLNQTSNCTSNTSNLKSLARSLSVMCSPDF